MTHTDDALRDLNVDELEESGRVCSWVYEASVVYGGGGGHCSGVVM
jgi:hypothetical protein